MCIIADVQVLARQKNKHEYYIYDVHWLNDVDKKIKTLKECLIENCLGEIEKDRKIVIFSMSYFGQHRNRLFMGQ